MSRFKIILTNYSIRIEEVQDDGTTGEIFRVSKDYGDEIALHTKHIDKDVLIKNPFDIKSFKEHWRQSNQHIPYNPEI